MNPAKKASTSSLIARKNKNGGFNSLAFTCLVLGCVAVVFWHYQKTYFEKTSESEIAQFAQPSSPLTPRKWYQANPLVIPPGEAVNLPSIRVKEKEEGNVDKVRSFYGGAGDKAHLGGFTELDLHGVSPHTWKHMIQDLNIHSILDVACGRGTSTSWFVDHGLAETTLCVEGSHDAFQKSMLDDPSKQMVEHDFSRGPWWPGRTFDAVWSVEFLEHVGINYHFNYISTFRKAALLFVTSSRWGGWHHVEVHTDEWWILKYQSYGFEYSPVLTDLVRGWAGEEHRSKTPLAPNGERYNAQHVWLTMKVFVNPGVASLPEHAHLLYPYRCPTESSSSSPNNRQIILDQLTGTNPSVSTSKVCDTVADDLKTPVVLTEQMDQVWYERIRRNISPPAAPVKPKGK
ncbi:hypothetical protein ACA910_015584 [Epithemia clementina (nom. ined.)]